MPHQIIAYLACFMVILGLFWARAIFATGIIILLGNALVNKDVVTNFKNLANHKTFCSIVFLFMIYAISGLWSKDVNTWGNSIQLHLPLLAIPIGIFSFKHLSKHQLMAIFYLYIAFCIGGCVWSYVQYLSNKDAFDAGYGISHVIPTPFKGDHIRFSIAVVLAIWFSYFCIQKINIVWLKILTWMAILIFVFYLHILSVKTGLVCFYILFVTLLIHQIKIKKNYKTAVLGLVVLICLPIVAFYTSNTFNRKMYYIKYSIVEMLDNKNDLGVSDEGRLISYTLALNIWKNNKLLGIGAGDIPQQLQKQFVITFPNTNPVRTLLPHNQLLMIMLVAGLFGAVVYLYFLLIPLFSYYKKSLLFIGFWLIVLIPQLVEPLHETQYGIAIHLFFYALIIRYLDFQHQ
jgi:O-antigen ligase